MELEQNDETIQKLKSENDSLKTCGFKASTVKWLIQKIKKQKSQYDTNFGGKEYALVLTGSEIEFIQSIDLSEDEVRTQDDVEKLLKYSARAGYILSKLYKARDSYNERTRLGAQDQSLEIVGPTTKPFGDERSIQCNTSSTQTDQVPTISHNLFRKLNNIRLEFTCPGMHLSKLEEMYESSKLNNAVHNNVQNRMNDLKTIVLKKQHLVSISTQQATEFTLLLQKYRKIKIFPKGSEIRESVLTCFDDSNTFYNENFSEGPNSNQRCCSSQTEISSLLIRSDLDEIATQDDVITKIEKMHGKLIILSYGTTKSQAHSDRLKQYCKDLNEGKEITVFASDIPDELKTQIEKLRCAVLGVTQDTNVVKNPGISLSKNADIPVRDLSKRRHSNSISDMQLIQHEIFAQLERKLKSTLNVEFDAAIKQSTESFQNLSSENIQLEIIKKNARIQQLESEIRIFKAASRKTSQLEKDLSKYKNIAATAQKFQSELAKLKNEMAQEKKSKNSSTSDKPNKRKS